MRSPVSHIPLSPLPRKKSKILFRATWSSVSIGFHGSDLNLLAPSNFRRGGGIEKAALS